MKCRSYCSHGGVCILHSEHEGLHSSNYCTWSDAEALNKADADVIFAATAAMHGCDGGIVDTIIDLT